MASRPQLLGVPPLRDTCHPTPWSKLVASLTGLRTTSTPQEAIRSRSPADTFFRPSSGKDLTPTAGFYLGVPSISIRPGSRIFSENHTKNQGKRIRFLKRTMMMVEKNGQGINPQKFGPRARPPPQVNPGRPTTSMDSMKGHCISPSKVGN